MIERIVQIWTAGGWVMLPLLVVALMTFFTAVKLWCELGQRQYRRLREVDWKKWVHQPEKGEGEVGEIIRYALDDTGSDRDISTRFAEVTALTLSPIDRQIQTLWAFVAAAPLVGLLGTVSGMLVTFQALAAGDGGGRLTEAMAAGISQALFPPELGLCIALPGLIFIQLIKHRRRELEAFLARLESYIIQWHHAKTIVSTAGQPAMRETSVKETTPALSQVALTA